MRRQISLCQERWEHSVRSGESIVLDRYNDNFQLENVPGRLKQKQGEVEEVSQLLLYCCGKTP